MKAREADKAIRSLVFNHSQNLKAKANNDKIAKEEAKPAIIEKVTEHVLINIQQVHFKTNELMGVLAAIHFYIEEAQTKVAAWSSMRKGYTKELTLFVDVYCDFHNLEFVSRVLELPTYCDEKDLPRPVDKYDMYCRYQRDIVSSFRDNGKFHAASAYGILLGCEAQSLFDIPAEKIIAGVENRDYTDILVIDDAYWNYDKVWQWLGIAVPRLKVSRVVPYMNNFRAMVAAIYDAKFVVGPTSEWTYLACCMKKPVFEIYPPNMSKNWLSKWSNPLYNMYVSDPTELDKDTLLKGVASLWQKAVILQAAQSKQLVVSPTLQEQTQTEPLQSDAESAATA